MFNIAYKVWYFYMNRFVHNLSLIIIIICIVSACTKDKPTQIEDKVYPLSPNGYFVEATGCGKVSETVLKSTAQLAGYPQFNQYFKYSIKLYRITYRTTYKGNSILASGLISYPTNVDDSIPSMFVGNGLTFADRDAPSAFHLPDNYTGFEFIASLGYFTLIPDMIGFGVSNNLTFPIQNYEYSANTMIDMIYAGREFIEAKQLKVNHKNYMAGYSQGAYIAMATLKMIQEKPVPDIKISATAVGGGGYNLVDMLNDALKKNTYSAPSHLAILFSSYNEIYEWNRPLTDFFQEPYADRIPDLLSGQFDRIEIDAQLAYSFDSLMNPVFLNNLKTGKEPAIIEAFSANNVDDWAPKSLLNIIHSVNDDRIPISNSQNTYNKMVLNGSTSVIFTPIDTNGHVESGITFVEKLIQWFSSLKN
jgi:hypothetical protein